MKKITFLLFAVLIAVCIASKCNAQAEQDSTVFIKLTAAQESYFSDIEKKQQADETKKLEAMMFIVTTKDSTYQLTRYPMHTRKQLMITIPKKKPRPKSP